MLSSFMNIFNFIWRSPKDRREARFELLGDLITYSSECEAWLIELHSARQYDPGVDLGDKTRAYLPQISKQDSVAQGLQWRFRKEFREPEILKGVSELMRRISFTRQMLLFGTPRTRQYCFADGLMWIKCQTSHLMQKCSEKVVVNMNDPQAPFFAGLLPLGMNCEEKYQNNEEPWLEGKQRTLQEELEELGVNKEDAKRHSRNAPN